MKRIAVITTFNEILEAFSLCRVVRLQLKGLLEHGYPCTFVACDGCVASGVFADPRLQQFRIPVASLDPDDAPAQHDVSFLALVKKIRKKLRPLIARTDVAITHDILYLPHFLAYNQACRELARDFPNVLWLHWVHSVPHQPQDYAEHDPRVLRFRGFPNGIFVYPNVSDIPLVTRQFAVSDHQVRIVPHTFDYSEAFHFHPITAALIERFDLYSPDVLAIYPVRLDRGKQPEKLVRLFAAIKKAGRSVRLLILNFHSTGDHFIEYRDEIHREARSLGLTADELVFSNEIESLPGLDGELVRRCQVEMPHQVIMDLFHLTNLHVHPSAAETYSLVCQEAAACGNLLVVNEDFPPMRSVYGDDVVGVNFCSIHRMTTYQPDETEYYDQATKRILASLDSNPIHQQRARIRQTRNPNAVFRNYIEPLLHDSPQAQSATAVDG